MNLLFIGYSFTPSKGGVEKVTDIITEELKRRGHNVYFLCANSQGDCKDCATDVFFMDKSINDPFDNESVKRYQDLLNEKKIDLIINQYPIHPKGFFFAKYAPNSIKKIAFYHGKPFGRNKWAIIDSFKNFRIRMVAYYINENIKTRSIFRKIYKYYDNVFFLCEGYARTVNKNIPCSLHVKAKWIPNPCAIDDKVRKLEKENIIVFVGRVSDQGKNLIGFIKIWEQLAPKFPEWKAVVIGDDSNCSDIKTYIDRKEIKNIKFTGQLPSTKPYFERAKIQCVTSHSEGWSMVTIEGMAEGCVPVVYDTFESIHEIIENEISGFIIPKYDVGAACRAISKLIENESLLNTVSSEARKITSKYSIDKIVDQWEQIITV